MDHEATRELLELAALEPDGLDRLMAGDTPTSQAVAGHLAGCPACSDELVRLHRASSVIRGVVRDMPPPELRERTLTAVGAIGVARGATTAIARPAIATEATAGNGPAAPTDASDEIGRAAVATKAPARTDRRQLIGWAATIAAAVILSVASTLLIVDARMADQLAVQSQSLAALADVTTAAMSIAAQPDALVVTLIGTTDPDLGGRLTFSPSTTQLVLVADGLSEPSAGQEYRAWVEVGNQRQRVGRLIFTDGVVYWSGPAPAVAGLEGSARFGVSLVESSATGGNAPALMIGEL